MSTFSIIEKITNGVYTIKKREDSKSYLWKVVALILTEDKTVLEGYVYCMKCEKVLPFSIGQNLHHHTCCRLFRNSVLAGGDENIAAKEESNLAWSLEDSCASTNSASSLAHKESRNEDSEEIDAGPIKKKIKYEPPLQKSEESLFLQELVKNEQEKSDNISDDEEFITLQSSDPHDEVSAAKERKTTADNVAINTTIDSDETASTLLLKKNVFIIKQKIAKGIYTLTDRPNGRSLMWNVLASIVHEDKTINRDFVYCRKCYKVLRTGKNKTSNLTRHKCCQLYRGSGFQTATADNATVTEQKHKEEEKSLNNSKHTQDTSAKIASNIAKGVYSLVTRQNARGDIWKVMDQIRNENGRILKNFLYCRKCCHVLKYNNPESGNIYQHKCWVLHKHSILAETSSDLKSNEDQDNSNKDDFFVNSTQELKSKPCEIEKSLAEEVKCEAEHAAVDETHSQTSELSMEEDSQRSKSADLNNAENEIEDAHTISKKIIKGIYTTQRSNRRSYIWQVMTDIQKEDGTILKGRVYCRKCRGIFANNISNLSRHKCCRDFRKITIMAAHLNDKTLEEDFFKPTISSGNSKFEFQQEALPEDKTEVVDVCAAWLFEDGRPTSIIEGSGFLKLAKFFIQMGATYGNDLDVTTILPATSRINTHMQKMAREKKLRIQDTLVDAVKNGTASASIDMWRDHYVKRNFIGVMIHYQKSSKYFNLVLGIKSMDPSKSSFSDVLQEVTGIFKNYGIEDIQELKFLYSTEEFSSTIAEALKHCTTLLKSSSHLLIKVLDKSFGETKELQAIINDCESFINLNKRQITVEESQKEPSGWLAFYGILKSAVDSLTKPSTSNGEESVQHSNINIPAVKTLSDLCKVFEVVHKRLTQCNSPSLCFVIPSITKISKICSPKATDDPAVAALKKNIVKYLDSIWKSQLTIWHKVAFFLYPPTIGLYLHQHHDDLEEIKLFCKAGIEKFKTESNLKLPTSSSSSTKTTDLGDVHFFFSGLMDDPDDMDEAETPEQEFNRYTREVVQMKENFDPLDWWKSNEKQFPRLSPLALQIHSIPASNAMAEEAFSLAGQLVTEKSKQLTANSIEDILFLHSYHKHFTT